MKVKELFNKCGDLWELTTDWFMNLEVWQAFLIIPTIMVILTIIGLFIGENEEKY